MKNNNDYLILTPDGWSDFDGVQRTTTDILFTIKTNNNILKCTSGHLLKYPNGQFLEASFCLIGDELWGGDVICEISYEEGDFYVYDVIDVKLNNEYFTNGLVSHNCAFMESANEIWTSAQMTLATGGNAIILSTPNGAQGIFYKLWCQAEEGIKEDGFGAFNPIRLDWKRHPDRDQKWRDLQDELMGKRMAAQENDCVFETSGHTVIESDILAYYREKTTDPTERRGIGGDYWIWKYPDYTKSYCVVADVARGDGEDSSAFIVMDVESLEQVAEYEGKIDTNMFGNMLVSVATEYNDALLVIDNKNIGWSTVQVCLDKGYKNLYYSYKNDPYLDENIHLMKRYDLKNKEDMIPGFTTTHVLRPVMISKLEMYTREKSPIIHSKRLINQFSVFMWINGKPQAQNGYNDDLVLCFCMFLYVRDTALRLRQMGIELVKQSITNVHKNVYNPAKQSHPAWEQRIGNHSESLKWLL
jgi:hypothetical protein